jgi:hypothetical protein
MQATIGPTGGNIATSGGAQIVIPEGALAADTMIGVEQTSTGAPPLPAGVKTFGPVVAFTPHGTSFALPATITVPFDAHRFRRERNSHWLRPTILRPGGK